MAIRLYKSTDNSMGVYGRFKRDEFYELDDSLPFVQAWVASGHLIDMSPKPSHAIPSDTPSLPPETTPDTPENQEEMELDTTGDDPVVAPPKPDRKKR